MIVHPSLPGGYVIFCDDIRHELNGKETFVGTYKSVMFINGTLPTTLPKLCMVIVYREEPDSLEPSTVKVFMPGDDDDTPSAIFELSPQADMIPPPSDEFMMRETHFMFEVPCVIIKEEGRIRVRAYRGDDEIRLGSMAVSLNPQ